MDNLISKIAVCFILLFVLINPSNAMITLGGCTGLDIFMGATCTATGFRDAGSGNTQTVWRLDDVDCSVSPRQILMSVTPFWDAPGTFKYQSVIQEGQTVTFTNVADSNDFVRYQVGSVFCGEPAFTVGNTYYQQTSYVSTSGNDASNGNSSSTSWLTISKAASTLIAGEDVIVASGTYNGFATNYNGQGTTNAPIIFKGDGSYPVVNPSGGYILLMRSGIKNIEITGFNATSGLSTSFFAQVGGVFGTNYTNINIHNNIIYGLSGNTRAIYIWSDATNVHCTDNVTIRDNSYTMLDATAVFYLDTSFAGGCYASLSYIYNNTFIGTNNGSATIYGVLFNQSGYGNYWSTYNGIDIDGNQIGDTPHNMGTVKDYYPKLDRESGYTKTVIGQVISGATINQTGATYRNTTSDANGYYALSTVGRNTITLNGSKFPTYSYGNKTVTYNSANANITLPANAPSTFDPSGYVKDGGGNPVYNAVVTLRNTTFTATPSYSLINGSWHTNIYADGNYDYFVNMSGSTVLTGNQAFTIGGSNYNFTIVANIGTIHGRVTSTIPNQGQHVYDVTPTDIKRSNIGAVITTGTGITIYADDGHQYFIKAIDGDSSQQQAAIQILKDGAVLTDLDGITYNSYLISVNQPINVRILETQNLNEYIDVMATNVFNAHENVRVTLNAGIKADMKALSTWQKFINDLISLPSDFWSGIVTGLSLWANLNANNNQQLISFNGSGESFSAVLPFDVGSNQVYTAHISVRGNSSSANAGKIVFQYADDNTDLSSTATYQDDTIYLNGNLARNFPGSTIDFKALDANNNGKIKVYFQFVSGYSGFGVYGISLITDGATTVSPIPGVLAFFNSVYQTYTDNNGNYSFQMPLAVNETVFYSKTGYESKNVTHTFNATYPDFEYNLMLNSTTKIQNTTQEYINVTPNPVVYGTQAYIYYRTLGHTDAFGNYQICIRPIGEDNTCSDGQGKIDVSGNAETSYPLPSLDVGDYSINLVGHKDWLDLLGTIYASNNFSVTSSSPRINWLKNPYYLGQKMILDIYVPSGTAYVNITSPSGAVIYANPFSAMTTLQNTSFQTDTSLTYPPGTYTARIQGGNTATTQLLNYSMSNYSLSAPSTVSRGQTFNINYVSPLNSVLSVVDTNNVEYYGKYVQGTSSYAFNTGTLPNQATTLTIKLTDNAGNIRNTTSTQVTMAFGGSGDTEAVNMIDGWTALFGMGVNTTSKMLFAVLFIVAGIFTGFMLAGRNLYGGVFGGAVPFFFFAWISYIPFWIVILLIIIVAIKVLR